MRCSRFLAMALGLVSATAAFAADQLVPAMPIVTPLVAAAGGPRWSVAGSLSSSFTDNALFSRTDRRSDFFYEPDLSLRLDGKLSPDTSWRLYARAAFDAFARVKDANEAQLRLGGRLTQNILDWRVSFTYENRYEFAGVFEDRLFTAHDVMGSVTRDFNIGQVTLSPLVLVTYRFADVAEARRSRLDLMLPFEVKLDERWSVVSIPFVEGYWFTDGLNSGRQDWIYSTSLGLKYNLRPNVSLTTSATYEVRTSNVALRHYRDLTVGPKLDFSF